VEDNGKWHELTLATVTDHLAIPDHNTIGRNGRRSRRTSEASTPSTRYSSHDSVQVSHRGVLPSSYGPMPNTSSVSPTRLSTPSPTSIHEPIRFEMFIRDSLRDESSLPLHTFTSFSKSQARVEDLHVADTMELCTQLPQLTSISSLEDLTSSQIIVAESRLRLMSDNLPRGAELSIQFEVSSLCNLGVYEDFNCETRFFEDGEPACEPIHGRIEYNAHYERMGNIQFGSDFWARKVIEMAQQLRRADDLRNKAEDLRSCGLDDGMSELAEPLEGKAKESDKEVKKSIEGMTGLQEISASFKATGEKVRLLIICWNFEQMLGEGEAETTWKNVAVGTSQNHLGQGHQLRLPLFQHEIFRHNNSFGPGSSVEDVSCVLPPHLQRRHSFNPHQLQQSHFGPLGLSTGSMGASDLSSSTLGYSNASSQSMDFPHNLQMSFNAPLQVSFGSSFNTPATGSFDASFDSSRSLDTTTGAQNPSPYSRNGPWQNSFHGPYSTGYFSPTPENDDTHSYTFGQRHESEEFKSHPYIDESRRHFVATSVGPYDNSPAYTPSYTPSPFIPSLSSFAEEVQRRECGGLIPDRMGMRRHSLAASFSHEASGHLTSASVGYAEGRRGSMGF
jgi:hypothetical protein